MRGSMMLRGAITIALGLLLAGSQAAWPQGAAKLQRVVIRPTDVLTIRVFWHPHWTSDTPIMEIFLKDPNAHGFILTGERGNVLESYHRMLEIAERLKSQPFTLLIDQQDETTEHNHPFFVAGAYSKKMYRIHGFYPPGYAASGPVASPSAGGQPESTELIPVQPVLPPPPGGQPSANHPSDEGTRGPMMHRAPGPEAVGYCCVQGQLIELPAEGCQIEKGKFFADPETARAQCRPGGSR
jgi:hypothetical protein